MLRIVGGKLSGRKIEPPASLTTRPMMDRVREALFNILVHRDWGSEIGELFIEETRVLDAFCGTGALAFEAISRGAGLATLFDKDRNAVEVASKNAASLKIKDNCVIQLIDTLAPPRAAKPCKLVFLAPPYRKNLILPAVESLRQAGWIAPHAVVVVETARKEELSVAEGFALVQQRTYGDTALHFWMR
jgi:16S rRNA (guanine966-N2)-methyltransferase